MHESDVVAAVREATAADDTHVEMTGGGCRAIIAPLTGPAQMWVTDQGGTRVTVDGDDNGWLVGYYPTEEAVSSGDGAVYEYGPTGAGDLETLRATIRAAIATIARTARNDA